MPLSLGPGLRAQPLRHQQTVGRLGGLLHDFIDYGDFTALTWTQRKTSHVLVADAGVGGQYLERSRVTGHLQVGVVEHRLPMFVLHLLVEVHHGFDLPLNLRTHCRQDALFEAGPFAGRTFPEHQDHRALDVATFLQLRGGFGRDIPGRHHLQARRPEDPDHV